jgi:hypothetical protein
MRRVFLAAVLWTASLAFPAQFPTEQAILRGIDKSVQDRVARVLSFTDVEHYQVFRGSDLKHPAAEMTVKVTYRKGIGKSYQILAQSGSVLIRKFGLIPLLENEKTINLPGNVERSWFTTANYAMRLQSDSPQALNGRACYVFAITPKRKAPNTLLGTLWVDAKTFATAQVDGVSSRNPSIWSGSTHLSRQYADIEGVPMAIRARAESNSNLIGHTVVTVDYGDYQLQLDPHFIPHAIQ